MNYKKTALVIVSIIIVVGLGVFAVKQKSGQVLAPVVKETATTTETQVPTKTDFGTNIPTDFPTDIPVEKGATFGQSYSLNYVGQKQLTIVFQSTKTVKENYSLYADFLVKQGWNISNKYESAKLSSLYGIKGSSDINVTINENITASSTKSQVSISVLKK